MSLASPTKTSLWKGKEKATEEDYADLRPVITYRHLHSHNLGVRDPLRVVGLCDSDAFYAACERVRLNLSVDAPVVVQQWESLIAVSYPARKFGISRMDKIKDARKKCPDLVSVHVATYKEGEKEPGYWDDIDTRTHKVSLDLYRRESTKIMNVFKEMLPTGEIEKASIDEAFIDFTQPVRDTILERYPHLANIPPNAPLGADTPLPPPPLEPDWTDKGHLIPIFPNEEGDDSSKDESKFPPTWHDVALCIAAEFMTKMRKQVLDTLGYSTSAGLARNKALAKLSASVQKPNGQSLLRNDAIPNYLRPMPFQKIRFLGGKLGKAFAEEYDVSSVGDLLTVSLDEMQNKFGEEALWVYELVRGIDRTEVKEKTAHFKSMLASKNLPKPITKSSEGPQWIRVLAAELALRLNEARETTPTLWPKTISLYLRKGYEAGRSKQAPFPFVKEVTVDVVASAGTKLWKEMTGNAKDVNVGALQLSFSNLGRAEAGQKNIDGFFQGPTKRTREDAEDDQPSDTKEGCASGSSSSSSSFVCGRCKKRIELRSHVVEVRGHDAETLAEAVAALRAEHDDFHFAQDLANAPVTNDTGPVIDAAPRPSKPSSAGRETKRRKKTGETSKGIARYFTKTT